MEAASLSRRGANWNLQGTVLVEESGRPCRLDYAVVCDREWRTQWARVSGWIGSALVTQRLARSPSGEWRQNGEVRAGVLGCVDLDLAFSPATNLLPIRRLALAVGAGETVRAAWLRFPDFQLVPLEQRYTRTGEQEYRYESGNGAFTAGISVDGDGLVVRYGALWVAEPLRPPGT